MNGEANHTPEIELPPFALPVIYARNRRPRGTSANTLNAARSPPDAVHVGLIAQDPFVNTQIGGADHTIHPHKGN